MGEPGWNPDLIQQPSAPLLTTPDPIFAKRPASQEEIKEIAIRFEIDTKYSEELRKLIYYEVIIILDDSRSMIAPASSFQTRWDEAHKMLQIISDLLGQLTGNDPLVRLLNRQEHWTASQLLNAWSTLTPMGPTPIRACLESLTLGKEVPSLIILITDGEPTQIIKQGGRMENVNDVEFYSFLESFQFRNEKNNINVILCTNSESTVKYWKKIDGLPRIDIIDDYETEQRRTNGRMTFGTYVAKVLLGSLVPHLDDDSDSCCSIL